MKKIITIFLVISFIFNISFIENIFAKNYLLTDKNYYKDNSINKGFLDEVISEENVKSPESGGETRWQRFQNAVAKNLVKYTPGMTFNEYFLANNISPEDAFKLYIAKGRGGDQEILLPSGALLNAETNPRGRTHNGEVVDYITYVGPYKDRSAYWGDRNLDTSIIFSRLTVGNKLISTTTNSQFSNQIGYGEDNTVNDYMLTSENNFVIPSRFNVKRDDLWLTMRSAGYFGNSMKDARAFLSAISDGENVLGERENPKFYLMTNSEILYTPFLYDQLGSNGKSFMTGSGFLCIFLPCLPSIQDQLKGLSINNFVTTMNSGLEQAQNYSGVRDIKGGLGGQIQIIGFYRFPINNDQNFWISEEERKQDSVKVVDVKYYMYTNSTPADATISTPLASNGKNLYSPNESVFKIEVTRPFFKNFGNMREEILFEEKTFDEKLGEKSYEIEDNGILKNGEKVTIAPENVRVRISENNGYNFDKNALTIAEFKEYLQKEENFGKKILVNYLYSAKDANPENIGKMPNEILDNTGAYALPFFRTVVIPSLVEVKYFDENGQEFENSFEKKFGKIGEKFETEEKVFEGYEFFEIEKNLEPKGEFTKEKITIIYKYKKLPEISKIFIKYVDENDNEIEKSEEKTGKIGEKYEISEKNIPDYEFVKIKDGDLKTGEFEKTEKIVTFIYKKIEKNTEGKIITKYLDEKGNEILPETEEIGKIGEKFSIKFKGIDGYDYERFEADENLVFAEKDQIVKLFYKKIEKNPTPVVPETGKIILKYILEYGTELEKEEKTGKVGEKYEISEKNISGYEFVKIKDGDTKTGEFEKGEKIITFIYKKVENNPTPTIPEIGKIIIKYVDEAGNEIKTETKEGKVGEKYDVSETQISGYEFVKILDGDSKTGNFEEKEKIITFIYKKIENKIENSGSSPVVPVIQKDPRVTDINKNIPKIEEPKTEEKPKDNPKVEELKKEVKNTLPKDFEAVSPMGDEEDVEVEKVIKKIEKTVKKLPTTGPITQEEIYKKGGKKKENSKVETKLPDARTFDLAQSGEKDLNVWLDKLPPKDRNKDKYVVLPEQGLILPINTVSRDSKEYKRFTSGKEENFEAYLNKGTVELPITRRGYGEIGNKIIAGHSSYWKKSKATYKTHFQKIIGLEKEEEVWIFEKNSKTKKFEKYIYKVTASYNTDDEDISILKQGKISELTLFTCTPIGGFDGRWVVKAKFLKKE